MRGAEPCRGEAAKFRNDIALKPDTATRCLHVSLSSVKTLDWLIDQKM
jgi:hypothetical protein